MIHFHLVKKTIYFNIKVLIGNKTDLKNNRIVQKNTAMMWCKKNGNIPYFETSAKDNEGIEEIFNYIANKAYNKQEEDENTAAEIFGLTENDSKKTTVKCCNR